MRAFLLIHVEALAVIAADAFAGDDLRTANRAPLAFLLADFAIVAFTPALDSEDREVRKQTEKRSDGAEKPAVQIANEHRRDEQDAGNAARGDVRRGGQCRMCRTYADSDAQAAQKIEHGRYVR